MLHHCGIAQHDVPGTAADLHNYSVSSDYIRSAEPEYSLSELLLNPYTFLPHIDAPNAFQPLRNSIPAPSHFLPNYQELLSISCQFLWGHHSRTQHQALFNLVILGLRPLTVTPFKHGSRVLPSA